jgi:hypothetical protein
LVRAGSHLAHLHGETGGRTTKMRRWWCGVYILRMCLKKREIITLSIQDAHLHAHPTQVRTLQGAHPRCTPRFHLRILVPPEPWNQARPAAVGGSPGDAVTALGGRMARRQSGRIPPVLERPGKRSKPAIPAVEIRPIRVRRRDDTERNAQPLRTAGHAPGIATFSGSPVTDREFRLFRIRSCRAAPVPY